MSMQFGTSPFVQSADIRKTNAQTGATLAAADAQRLDTAIKQEERDKFDTAQNIIRKHVNADGTDIDYNGAMKDLYEFSPEHADMFAKEYLAHVQNKLQAARDQSNLSDLPETLRFQHEVWAKQGYGPLANQNAPGTPAPASNAPGTQTTPVQNGPTQGSPMQPTAPAAPYTGAMGTLSSMLGPDPTAGVTPQQGVMPPPSGMDRLQNAMGPDPTAGVIPSVAPYYYKMPPLTLEQEQAYTQNMDNQPVQMYPSYPSGVDLSGPQPAAPLSSIGGAQTVAAGSTPAPVSSIGQQTTAPDTQPAAPVNSAQDYLNYVLNPVRESMAGINPNLATKDNAAALYKANVTGAGNSNFMPGGVGFGTVAAAIKANMPLSKILSGLNRTDKTQAMEAYYSPEMEQYTGVKMAENAVPTEFNFNSGNAAQTKTAVQQVTNEVTAQNDISKAVNSGQGVIGSQIKKMDVAMHARNALARSAVVGPGGKVSYAMTPELFEELIASTASMLNNGSQATDTQRDALSMKAIGQDVGHIKQYFASHPVLSVPPENVAYLKRIIDGQGSASEDIANGAINQMKDNWRPKLTNKAQEKLDKTNFGHSYRNYSAQMDEVEKTGGNDLQPFTPSSIKFNSEDQKMMNWADQHPNDPKTTAIRAAIIAKYR